MKNITRIVIVSLIFASFTLAPLAGSASSQTKQFNTKFVDWCPTGKRKC